MADAQAAQATLTNGNRAHSQRRFSRATVHLEARFESASQPRSTPAQIHNLGGGGMRLAATEEIPREEIVTVRFALPKSDHEILVRGKVVLSSYDANTTSFLHGVAFTQMIPADQKAIVAFVESIEHDEKDNS